LLSNTSFVILDSAQLTRLFTFNVPANAGTFTWSPDGQKLALLLGQGDQVSSWRLQIWNLRTRQMDTQALFPGLREGYNGTLAWSPDGEHIAALCHGQLIIMHVAETLSSYQLNESNNGVLAWSPDSRYLAVASGSEFCVWDSVERMKVRVFNPNNMSFYSGALAWSKDGKSIRIIAPVYQQENWDWP
jgi:Tol biopolymer transport system component